MPNDNAQNTGFSHETEYNLPLAYPYVPMQRFQNRYSNEDAVIRGTIFPELDLPFKDYLIKSPLPETLKTDIMCIGFVCYELRLYLDTHPNDTKVSEFYKQYSKILRELKEKDSELSEKPGYNSWGTYF